MIKRDPSDEEFLGHVAKHELTIVADGDRHRQLTFKDPATFNRHFHLTTWPGYLAFSGDMGCFVFARLPDMFEFFRGDSIDFGYWAEKLQAVDKSDGYMEFSAAFYHAAIKSDFEGWGFDDERQKAEAWKAIERAGLTDDPYDVDQALNDAMRYKCPVTGRGFPDFYEHTLKDFTWRFVWACRAIRWGIEQYDAAKAKAA